MGNKKMKNKLFMMLNVCTLATVIFSGCTAADEMKKDLKEDMEWTRDNNAGGESYDEEVADKAIKALGGTDKPVEKEKYAMGDVVSFTTDNGGEIEVELKECEAGTDESGNAVVCIKYVIKNTGDVDVEVGNGQFKIYADDTKVKQLRIGENVIGSENISSRRKISGTLYGKVDVNDIDNLDVEYGNAVFEVISK